MYVVFKITGHSLLENRDLKYNSTVLKQPQTVTDFHKKLYFAQLFLSMFQKYSTTTISTPFFLHSNSPEHTVFSFFSAHK